MDKNIVLREKQKEKYIRSRGKYIRELMREITKLTISFFIFDFFIYLWCVCAGSNVIGTLFQLTPKVTTCADIYAKLLIMPLSNPWLGSLSYSDTQESISMNYIMYESGIQNNTCLHIKGLGLVITSVTDGADWLM